MSAYSASRSAGVLALSRNVARRLAKIHGWSGLEVPLAWVYPRQIFTVDDLIPAPYKTFSKARLYHKRAKLALGLLDEHTRPGATLQTGIHLATTILGKIDGLGITDHPYFVFHSQHIVHLGNALNAVSAAKLAEEEFRSAMRSAQAIGEVQPTCELIRKTAVSYCSSFIDSFAPALIHHRQVEEGDVGAIIIAMRDQISQEGLGVVIASSMSTFRAAWALLHELLLPMCIMVASETVQAMRAVDRFNQRIARLQASSNNFDYVAGELAERNVLLERAAALRGSSAAAQARIIDPVSYSLDNLERVHRLMVAITLGADVAMSEMLESQPQAAVDWFKDYKRSLENLET